MKTRLLRCLCLLLAAVLCLTGCAGDTDHPDSPSDAPASDAGPVETGGDDEPDRTASAAAADPAVLAEGLTVREVFSYSGAYVEDGGNEPCENICAVRVENNSPRHYRYLRFTVTTVGGSCTFVATTLFAGARMTVLCEEKAAFTDGNIIASAILNEVLFDEPPTVHLDTLRINYTDGFINVKNLTDEALTNVYVYFKDTDEYGYLGGITYRAHFGDLAAGQTAQKSAVNIHRDTGRVVFTTYDS